MDHWFTYMPHYFLEVKRLVIHGLSLEEWFIVDQTVNSDDFTIIIIEKILFYKLFLNEVGTYFCTYSAHSTHGVNRILPSKCLRTEQNAISSCNVSSLGNKYLQIRLVLRKVQVYRPSRTAFATSVASARVGRRLSIMLSTTLVMITGLPAMLHL